MYHHVKKLMYTVRVDEPDPHFGNMLLEQFGGANGELAAAMQYSIQGLNCDDPGRKDLLMDIGTEELSHLEIVGTLARMHLKPLKSSTRFSRAPRASGPFPNRRYYSRCGEPSSAVTIRCRTSWDRAQPRQPRISADGSFAGPSSDEEARRHGQEKHNLCAFC